MTADNGDLDEAFWSAIDKFMLHIAGLLQKRWDAWAPKHEDRDMAEVLGALLSRQVT